MVWELPDLAAKVPLSCSKKTNDATKQQVCNSRSQSVLFPWSTWAMMPHKPDLPFLFQATGYPFCLVKSNAFQSKHQRLSAKVYWPSKVDKQVPPSSLWPLLIAPAFQPSLNFSAKSLQHDPSKIKRKVLVNVGTHANIPSTRQEKMKKRKKPKEKQRNETQASCWSSGCAPGGFGRPPAGRPKGSESCYSGLMLLVRNNYGCSRWLLVMLPVTIYIYIYIYLCV